MRAFLAILLAGVLAACTMTVPVKHPDPLPADTFPEVGQLLLFGQLQCSVVMVEPDVALTAAHCLDCGELWYDFLSVQVGDIRAEVIDVEVHPDYSRYTYFADIALIRLDQPVIAEWLTARLYQHPVEMSDIGRPIVAVGWSLGIKEDHESWLLGRLFGDLVTFLADPGHLYFGDSGGGTYIVLPGGAVRLVGINSLMVTSFITEKPLCSMATEIHVHKDWYESVLSEWTLNDNTSD